MTQFIVRRAGTALLKALANAAGLQVDSSDEKLKFYDKTAGVVRSVYDGRKTVITPTGAVTLTAEQTGAEVMLNAAAGFAITLPAPAAGLNFRFTVAAAFATTDFTIVTNGSANIIQGGAMVAGAEVTAADEDTITFVADGEEKGDWVEVWSDGTSWFVNGRAKTASKLTFTQAS